MNVAGPSAPAASGQALKEILGEEICTLRQVDCGHKILFTRLLCLFFKGADALRDLALLPV